MRTITFAALRDQVERNKAAIGWIDDDGTETLRNRGLGRTPAKRAFLARIDARAKAAGRDAVPSNY